jgi:AraC-like DNA-binding protein
VFSHSTVSGSWGLRFEEVPGVAVHAIVDGEMHLWAEDPADALPLLPGDVVLVRGSVVHHMAHEAGAPCDPLEEHLAAGLQQSPSRRFVTGAVQDRPSAVFFCGAYMFEGDLCDGLLDALPDLVRLRPAAGSLLRATMDLLAREVLRDEPGQQTLLDRLLDVALIQVLREHFAAHQASAPAWFRALADPRIGAVLRAVHASPGRHWTVAELAGEALLSRAAFARRFAAQLGVGPLAYLNDWRMALARERLRDSDDGLAAIAESLGYASEFSFAAAFKRRYGTPPGRWRTRAHTAGDRRPTPAHAPLHEERVQPGYAQRGRRSEEDQDQRLSGSSSSKALAQSLEVNRT